MMILPDQRSELEGFGLIDSDAELPSVLREVSQVLGDQVQFDVLSLVLCDQELTEFNATKCGTRLVPLSLELVAADSPAKWVWCEHKPLILDLEQEERWPSILNPLRQVGLKSYCLLPLFADGVRFGAIGWGSIEPRAYSVARLESLKLVATNAARTLHRRAMEANRSSWETELVEERDRLRLLLDVSNAVSVHLQLRDLFAAISGCVRRVMQHDYASLSLYDSELGHFRLHALDFPDGTGLIREDMAFPATGSPHGEALTSGRPLLVKRLDAQQFPSAITNWLLSEGIKSACWLPLLRGTRVVGVLNVASKLENAFTNEEVQLLSQVANQIAIAVENALAFQQITELKNQLSDEKNYLEHEIRTECHYGQMIGDSPAWRTLLQQVQTVAQTDATVLILGETGTGKELIARAIHDQSRRRCRTFVKMSCAALPAGLLEAELFGHERGAFTGAIARRVGRFELAHRGTLLLDEAGEIALELQPKILRVLQEQEFERLGSTETRKTDVRIIAATNRDLGQMVARREFRDDLYYRLNVFPIIVPPLRDRSTDISLLARYFVQKFSARMRKRVDVIPPDALTALSRWHWPGNVRELENFIERAVILTRGSSLQVPISELKLSVPTAVEEKLTLEAIEREHILRVVRECRGVIGGSLGAAAKLGLNRSTLNSRMHKLGISRCEMK